MPSSPTTNASVTPRAASSCAVTNAEVSTSSPAAAMPKPLSKPATTSGVLPELFVTNATRLPAARSRAIASGAPGTTSVPR